MLPTLLLKILIVIIRYTISSSVYGSGNADKKFYVEPREEKKNRLRLNKHVVVFTTRTLLTMLVLGSRTKTLIC